jgi:hypothetical protein
MWELAAKRGIGYMFPGSKTREMTVEDVWDVMPSVNNRKPKRYVKWREFLGACKAVAQSQTERTVLPVRIFDLSINTGESLSCLMLEIWASEIMDLPLGDNHKLAFFNQFKQIRWGVPGNKGMSDWIEDSDYRLAFYRSWLLLLEVITLSDLVDRQTIPKLKTRPLSGAAVATRHWYKTACGKQMCPVTNEPSLPVRMPGHFSVRGDWFLAVAGGSRSERLARRALDLLSTRRANFRRMELGIGLPTRDTTPRRMFDRLPTALIKLDTRRRSVAVTYGELIGQGVERDSAEFGWFWRSQLCDYHRHNRLWRQWIGQMIVKWDDIRNQAGPTWRSGFEIYDRLDGKSTAEAMNIIKRLHLKSWGEFNRMCDVLQKQLRTATNSPGG